MSVLTFSFAPGGFSHVYLVNLDIEDQNIKTRQAVLKQIHLKDELALDKAKNEIDVMVTISQQ
jgi:hypothetical protein